LDKQASEIVSSDVVGGINKDKAGEITHGVHKISLATIIGNVTGSPEIHMKDVERATEGPRKNEFAVTGDRTIGSDAMRALEDPIGDIFAAVWPEKP
jgi:hypothetical protein